MRTLTINATRLLTILLLGLSPALGQDQDDDAPTTLRDALAKGDASVVLRYRYEFVDDGAFEKDAHASTLRTTVGYRTLPYKGLSLFVEAQNVAPIFNDDYYNNAGAGSLWNEVDDRPVVADPAQTRMQQVYLRADFLDTAVDFGRREIFYGDHRFIGDVRWRQNHQAFDAVYLVNRSIDNATLSYTYADNVLRVNGGEKDMSSHFLNGLVRFDRDISLELFGYLLDYEQELDYHLSSQTFGFRLLGSPSVADDWRVHFELEYGNEKDFQNNPNDFSVNYLELVGGFGYQSYFNVRLSRERLGSDGMFAFQTPLATGHKFNGWADRFLVTPKEGLVDWFLTVDGKIDTVSWWVTYHNFSADFTDASYGTELDAQVNYPTPWNQLFAAKFALYREDGFSQDTSKFWFWTQYAF